jgi:hypothetical protein
MGRIDRAVGDRRIVGYGGYDICEDTISDSSKLADTDSG